MRELSGINAQIQQRIQNRDQAGYAAASVYAEAHEAPTCRNPCRVAGKRGAQRVCGKARCRRLGRRGEQGEPAAEQRTRSSAKLFRSVLSTGQPKLHPKQAVVLDLVREQLETHPESRIIIFATFRDTVQLLVDFLNANGIACERFVGQATKDAEKGALAEEADRGLYPVQGRRVQSTRCNRRLAKRGSMSPLPISFIFYEPSLPRSAPSSAKDVPAGRQREGSLSLLRKGPPMRSSGT